MRVTVFARKRKTKDGRAFTSYLAKLNRVDGSEMTVTVKFREDCGAPKPEECPMIIAVDKMDANLSVRSFIREDTGEAAQGFTLWVTKWTPTAETYVDHSLDDIQD